LAFSREIGRKVIFASSRILPWVLAVGCGDQSLRGLQVRLCFGDAFVYDARGHCYAYWANNLDFALKLLTCGGIGFEC
jgi:hypothetical protein